jgi:hypothetical protein
VVGRFVIGHGPWHETHVPHVPDMNATLVEGDRASEGLRRRSACQYVGVVPSRGRAQGDPLGTISRSLD